VGDCQPNTRCALQVFIQKRSGLRLSPLTVLYYEAPCCFAFLLLPWAFLEAPRLLSTQSELADIRLSVLLTSGTAAFALNLVREK
jgi:hypothetical protein